MNKMTLKEREKEILQKERKWEHEKQILEREYILKREQEELKEHFKKKKIRKNIANSKLLVWFLFINCTIIELFTLVVIFKELGLAAQGLLEPDLSPLITLITTVVAEVIGFGVYALKSAKENTEGGIVYETAMRALEHPDENEGVG